MEFDHVDDTVLARHLRERFAPNVVRYDRGSLWVYKGGAQESGVWTPMSEAEARNQAARVLADCVHVRERDDSGAASKSAKVKADAGRLRAIVERLSDMTYSEGFFDAAPACVVLTDCVLTLTADGEVEIHEHADTWGATSRFDLAWDPCAVAPTWLSALDEWFDGDDDAEAKIALLQEFAGACMFGVATQYQRALCLVGAGANGKSIWLSVIRDLFAEEDRCAVTPQAMAGRSGEYYRACLAGKRLNLVAEMPNAGLLEASDIKAIVAGDAVMGRSAYGHPFEFEPRAGHIFSANELPRTTDLSRGFWRRWLLVPFNRTFAVGPRGALIAKACANGERVGVVNWCIDGARRLVKRGHYELPESHLEMIGEWEKDSNSVVLWASECLEVGEQYLTSLPPLYDAYKRWAEERGYKGMTERTFGRRLGSVVERKRTKAMRGYQCQLAQLRAL